jgi:hypothetical protein
MKSMFFFTYKTMKQLCTGKRKQKWVKGTHKERARRVIFI